MKALSRRPYRQKKRAANAASTRARILRAARQLFEREGLFGVTLDEVADRAGVSRATVFQVFGTKAALLDAVAAQAEDSPEFRALLAVLGERDPSRALGKIIETGCLFWAKNTRLVGALSMLASIDREIAHSVAHREALRAESIAALTARLAAAGRLRRGIERRRATEILSLATSFAAFDELRRKQGLSLSEIQRVLRVVVESALLIPLDDR
jgi:AcrR family transcriptional regulator